jgi:hypothetical protein
VFPLFIEKLFYALKCISFDYPINSPGILFYAQALFWLEVTLSEPISNVHQKLRFECGLTKKESQIGRKNEMHLI